MPNDVSNETLAQNKAHGVVGVALNAALLGPERFQKVDTLIGRLAKLDLYAQIQVKDDQFLALLPLLERTHPRVLIDHSGRPDASASLQQLAFQRSCHWPATDAPSSNSPGCRSTPGRVTPMPMPSHTNWHCCRRSLPTTACGARTDRFCARVKTWNWAPFWPTSARCSRMPVTAKRFFGKPQNDCLALPLDPISHG
ncbi:hypothetical protein D3C85_1363690 [compost metagenome]